MAETKIEGGSAEAYAAGIIVGLCSDQSMSLEEARELVRKHREAVLAAALPEEAGNGE